MGFPIMLGFLGIYVMEKFIMVHPCEEGACDYHKIGVAAYVGIGFHSILDGVAIGAGNMLNISLVILLAVTIHKFPGGVGAQQYSGERRRVFTEENSGFHVHLCAGDSHWRVGFHECDGSPQS